MIQPVNALAPKVSFRGEKDGSVNTDSGNYKRVFAYSRKVFSSVAFGTAATIAFRTCTSNWAHAAILGAMTTIAALMYFIPGLKYKADKEATTLIKEADSGSAKRAITYFADWGSRKAQTAKVKSLKMIV